MESPGTLDKDDGVTRINRMEPGHIDVVLGSHPGRSLPRPLREPRPYGLILLCALLAILSICLLLSQLRHHAPEIAPSSAASKHTSVAPLATPAQPEATDTVPPSQPPDPHE